MPAVSVGIPTYRGAAHIAETIESVLAQTFADFELVIVDDVSPDETAEVVARYRDPRLRFVRNERTLGVEENWNRCLRLARGRYFKLLPHDDLIAPECLAREVEVLDADPGGRLAFVFCARRIIDEHSRALLTRGYPHQGGVIPARSAARRCIRRGANLLGEPGGLLFRTALAQRVGDFDASLRIVTDLDYWFRLLLHGDAYYLSENLASFRVSRGAWSVAIGAAQGTEFRAFIAKVGANPAYGLSAPDMACGRLMAQANTLAKLAFYRFVLR
ncbi:MAG TPA: glycosyltransferase [Burkholderiales bacterium]|nr:glycosyltransferase [Burkholderiales bacterium]